MIVWAGGEVYGERTAGAISIATCNVLSRQSHIEIFAEIDFSAFGVVYEEVSIA